MLLVSVGWGYMKVDFDSVPNNQRCPTWASDGGEFKQRVYNILSAIWASWWQLSGWPTVFQAKQRPSEPWSCSGNPRLQSLICWEVILNYALIFRPPNRQLLSSRLFLSLSCLLTASLRSLGRIKRTSVCGRVRISIGQCLWNGGVYVEF